MEPGWYSFRGRDYAANARKRDKGSDGWIAAFAVWFTCCETRILKPYSEEESCRPWFSNGSNGNGIGEEAAASADDPPFRFISMNATKRSAKTAPLTTQNHKRIPTAIRAQAYKVADQLKYRATN